jgi:hypothetical protein
MSVNNNMKVNDECINKKNNSMILNDQNGKITGKKSLNFSENHSLPTTTTTPSSNSSSTIQTTNNCLSCHLKNNFVYINNNLVNMNKKSTDIHDYAIFTKMTHLNHIIYNHSTFADYKISGLDETNNSNSNGSTNDTQTLILNDWFKIIIEYLLHNSGHATSNSPSGILNLFAHYSFNNSLSQLFESNLVNFFLNTLNGNFFKLKHFIHYLQITLASMIEKVKIDLTNNKVSISGCGEESYECLLKKLKSNELNANSQEFNLAKLLNSNDLSNFKFDYSLKSYIVLNEIIKLMCSTRTLDMFIAKVKNFNTSSWASSSHSSRQTHSPLSSSPLFTKSNQLIIDNCFQLNSINPTENGSSPNIVSNKPILVSSRDRSQHLITDL